MSGANEQEFVESASFYAFRLDDVNPINEQIAKYYYEDSGRYEAHILSKEVLALVGESSEGLPYAYGDYTYQVSRDMYNDVFVRFFETMTLTKEAVCPPAGSYPLKN